MARVPDTSPGAATKPLLDQTSIEQGVAVCLAEYQALIGEMEWLRREGSQYQGYAIALVAGIAPFFAFILRDLPDLLVPALLIVPFPFSVLGFLFFRQHEEVYVIAAYLRDQVRPQLCRLTTLTEIWGWEEFKSRYFVSIQGGRLFRTLSSGKMALVMRVLLFVLPAVVALISAVLVVIQRDPTALVDKYGWGFATLVIAGFLLDICLVGLLITFLGLQGDFAKRILAMGSVRQGLTTMSSPNSPPSR